MRLGMIRQPDDPGPRADAELQRIQRETLRKTLNLFAVSNAVLLLVLAMVIGLWSATRDDLALCRAGQTREARP